jgi:hypothetical protein
MQSRLRRLLVVLLVGLLTVVVTDASAHAATCPCKKLSLPQKVTKADGVFSGTVSMASGPTTSGKRQLMSYDVKVDRVYKGDIESPIVSVKSAVGTSACGSVPLTADNRYLFFVRANGTNLVAAPCGGTGPAMSAKTQRIKALLGQGTTPVPPTPARATFTPVADAEPQTLTKMAAPGAAMLLIGLLGLMVFGALGRSRKS